jgi:hypothetical protein
MDATPDCADAIIGTAIREEIKIMGNENFLRLLPAIICLFRYDGIGDLAPLTGRDPALDYTFMVRRTRTNSLWQE